MNQNEKIKYWIELASRDLVTAQKMYDNGEYHWALFIGHLILEKSIKAFYSFTNSDSIPPKTHDLVKLSKLSGLTLSQEQLIFYNRVNDFNIEARYPDEKLNFYKIANKEFSQINLEKIIKEHLWIKSLLKY